MQTLKTSLLLVGSWPVHLKDTGAVIAHDLGEALSILHDNSFDVVALTVTAVLEKRFADFYSRLKTKNPAAQILLVAPVEFDSKQIVHLYNQYGVHRVLNGFSDAGLNEAIFSALEKAQQEKQNQNLETLIHDQNQTLLRLQQDLEQRIEKRARSLSESRHRLRVLNSRTEALRRSMLAVYQASSLPAMEQLLNESLASVAECSWIKIVTHPQDQSFQVQIKQMGSFTQLQIPLFKEQDRIGSLFFMRPPQESFTREESDFLNRVAEAVALAVIRIQKLNDSQNVKEQWETTFNSMSEPVAIISQDYDLVQTNSSARSLTKSSDDSKTKCYEILFGRNRPCPGCQLGARFRIESKSSAPRTYDVYSQSVRLDSERKNLFFNMYHDITERLRIEQQLLDSAKRAELGTIGSSIAHELNNPLGGILTFTQILKSETSPDLPLHADLVALEQGALRCKDIIQNLLEFSRKPSNNDLQKINLVEILQKVIRLLEVKTKPAGITVELESPSKTVMIDAEPGRLSQVLAHILQQQVQNILDTPKLKKGQIILRISTSTDGLLLEAYDNSPGPLWDKNVNSFSYSLVGQVLRDFAASLEIPAPSSLDPKAKISFSRPVLGPEHR
jgi:two-component system NtrC family sensor kinase